MSLSPVSEKEIEFEKLFGIPWAFKKNELVGAFWWSSTLQACKALRKEAALLAEQGLGELPLESTRKKLRKLSQAKNEQAKFLETLMGPLKIFEETANRVGPDFLSELFFKQDLLSYIDNIHRDWIWGDKENETSIELIKKTLGGHDVFEKTLVLGSGASRLAFDFHQAGLSQKTEAIDINPLLLVSAKEYLFGKGLKLYDFPIAPLGQENSLILNKFKKNSKDEHKEGLSFLLADATELPHPDQSVDCVMTPWLVDILPHGAETLMKEIYRVLKPGGSWLFFGPLGFTHQRAAHHYSIEELEELSKLAGFSKEGANEEVMAYMDNPHSQHARKENTYCRLFKKVGEFKVPIVAPVQGHEWLENSDRAIPLSEEMMVMRETHKVYATFLSLVDGHTPLKGLAKKIAPTWGLSEEQALESLRRFFSRISKDL